MDLMSCLYGAFMGSMITFSLTINICQRGEFKRRDEEKKRLEIEDIKKKVERLHRETTYSKFNLD